MHHFHYVPPGFTNMGSLDANVLVHGPLLKTSQQAQDGVARAKISNRRLRFRFGSPRDGASVRSLWHPLVGTPWLATGRCLPRDTVPQDRELPQPNPHAWLCVTSLSPLPLPVEASRVVHLHAFHWMGCC